MPLEHKSELEIEVSQHVICMDGGCGDGRLRSNQWRFPGLSFEL